MNIIRAFQQYISESIAEIGRVSWPSRKQATQYTWVVVSVSVVTSIFLGGLDLMFASLLRLGVL